MEDKVAKLQAASVEAESQMQKHKQVLKGSQERVDAAKALLRQVPEEEQSKIFIADTKLPELLEMHAIAKEEYETSQKRYETNKRYLSLCKEKLGVSADRGIMITNRIERHVNKGGSSEVV